MPLDTFDWMREAIESAGFTNVHESVIKVPFGGWAKHLLLKEAGKLRKYMVKETLHLDRPLTEPQI